MNPFSDALEQADEWCSRLGAPPEGSAAVSP
jgi:hypothetical protein